MQGQYPMEETCSELTFNFWHALKVFYGSYFFITKNVFRKK
jgi:hypothetical protein